MLFHVKETSSYLSWVKTSTKPWCERMTHFKWHKWAKQTVRGNTPCCLHTTLRQAACLAKQPGLQLTWLPVAHRRPRQDLLSRQATLSFAIGHQERVLFEADRLRVHQALLFFSYKCRRINGCWWASTLSSGGPIRGELGSMKIICVFRLEHVLRVQTWTGLRVHVVQRFCGES